MTAADLSTTCSYEFVKKIGRGNYGTAWLVRRTFRRDSSKEAKSSAATGTGDEEHVVIKKIQLLNMKDSEIAQTSPK